MPSKTVTLSTAMLTRASAAISVRHGYEPFIDGQPNPESKEQFLWRWWLGLLKQEVMAHEDATQKAALATPAEIVITIT